LTNGIFYTLITGLCRTCRKWGTSVF